MLGSPAQNVANFVGETKFLPSTIRWSAPGLIGFRPLPVFAMELFTKLFGNHLAFVYHCFDRIVIHGYLSALSRPEQVVHFFRQVLGIPVVSKEILSQRTADYQNWVEAFARNHHTPIAWAEKGVRKEDHVLPWQRRMGLDHLDAVRQTFQAITDRFAGFQAQWLNVHVDFPLLQRIALPITIGSVRYPGIKIHDTRVIRLCEVLLHGGTHVGGWTAKQIHQAVLTTFHLSDKGYGLNQLRYDLRKLKGHGLIERDGTRYAYRLTAKGVDVALLFLFFHKR